MKKVKKNAVREHRVAREPDAARCKGGGAERPDREVGEIVGCPVCGNAVVLLGA